MNTKKQKQLYNKSIDRKILENTQNMSKRNKEIKNVKKLEDMVSPWERHISKKIPEGEN